MGEQTTSPRPPMPGVTPHLRRSRAGLFIARIVALGVFGASSLVTLIEDPKEIAKQRTEHNHSTLCKGTGTASASGFDGVTFVDRETLLSWYATPLRLDWDGALAHCAAISLEGGGWRLPTRDELARFHKTFVRSLD